MAFTLLSGSAHAGGNDILMNQRNAADTGTLSRLVVHPLSTGILGYDAVADLPVFFTLGSGLSMSGGVLSATLGAVSWSSITGTPTTIAGYGITDAFNGSYGSLTGVPLTFAPSAHTQAFSTITATPTTLAGYGIADAYPLAGNPSGFLTAITSGQITSALGFTPYNTTNPSGFVGQAGARSAISLTTTGTSGTATYNSSTGVLNVPNYAPGTGTVTSVTAGTGLSGGTITTSGTISMPNTGTAGTYNTVVTDAQGRVTSGTGRNQSSATRTLNTVFQVSATRDANVSYAVQCTVTSSIGSGQDGDVFLDIAADAAFTTSVQSVDVSPCSQVVTLAIALQSVQKGAVSVRGFVPAGYYARIRTVNNTGAPAFLYRLGQEVLQ
jgi:hypothetical protein